MLVRKDSYLHTDFYGNIRRMKTKRKLEKKGGVNGN
jgi:hypothetical protein